MIDARHDACGASTRVRVPGTLEPRALRRFHCTACAAAFEARHVEEVELRMANGMAAGEVAVRTPEPVVAQAEVVNVEAQPVAMEDRAVEALTRLPAPKPKLALPSISIPPISLPSITLPKIDPDSRTWKLASLGIAALLVVAILVALNGGDDQAPLPAPAPQTEAGTVVPANDDGGGKAGGGRENAGGGAKGSKNTKFVHEGSFSLALPAGWERIDPPAGATFAAVAADGGADATLWITREPKLDFPTFVNQSLDQLKTLAGSASVCERSPAPTPESTIVTLCADAPAGQPSYRATLRVAGPYRYYLGTTVQPDATAETADDVDLIAGSLTPELEG